MSVHTNPSQILRVRLSVHMSNAFPIGHWWSSMHHVIAWSFPHSNTQPIDSLKQKSPKSDLGKFATLVSNCSSEWPLSAGNEMFYCVSCVIVNRAATRWPSTNRGYDIKHIFVKLRKSKMWLGQNILMENASVWIGIFGPTLWDLSKIFG
jgi:hypothetical protein